MGLALFKSIFLITQKRFINRVNEVYFFNKISLYIVFIYLPTCVYEQWRLWRPQRGGGGGGGDILVFSYIRRLWQFWQFQKNEFFGVITKQNECSRSSHKTIPFLIYNLTPPAPLDTYSRLFPSLYIKPEGTCKIHFRPLTGYGFPHPPGGIL